MSWLLTMGGLCFGCCAAFAYRTWHSRRTIRLSDGYGPMLG